MQRLAAALVLAAACGSGQDRAVPATGEEDLSLRFDYRIAALGTLGGNNSSGNSINDLGWIAGTSATSGDAAIRATLWKNSAAQDLGTLGGNSSGVIWPSHNIVGAISGISETADIDPLGEAWSCSAFLPTTNHTCRGFVWQNGAMRSLPTLGGNNGFATGTNNLGQTAGWAENSVMDPTCTHPAQYLQFRAVVWGPGDRIQELPPFGSDSTSAATALDDAGHVVGISGDCGVAVGGVSARHALLWDHGRAIDLGNIGGEYWNTPMAMNALGVVVGFANAAGTTPPTHFNVHAFVWTRATGMQDLGTLPGDRTSQALGVNLEGTIVGLSCGSTCRAVMWKNGRIVDLNGMDGGWPDQLFAAGDIDDFGVIGGQALQADGTFYTFRATPSISLQQ